LERLEEERFQRELLAERAEFLRLEKEKLNAQELDEDQLEEARLEQEIEQERLELMRIEEERLEREVEMEDQLEEARLEQEIEQERLELLRSIRPGPGSDDADAESEMRLAEEEEEQLRLAEARMERELEEERLELIRLEQERQAAEDGRVDENYKRLQAEKAREEQLADEERRRAKESDRQATLNPLQPVKTETESQADRQQATSPPILPPPKATGTVAARTGKKNLAPSREKYTPPRTMQPFVPAPVEEAKRETEVDGTEVKSATLQSPLNAPLVEMMREGREERSHAAIKPGPTEKLAIVPPLNNSPSPSQGRISLFLSFLFFQLLFCFVLFCFFLV
jgi:hypothetical protein